VGGIPSTFTHHSKSAVTLDYDLILLAITAHLPRTTEIYVSLRDWRQHPGMDLSMVESMTIVVSGEEKVDIVYPCCELVM
jgi:hypothetical protein